MNNGNTLQEFFEELDYHTRSYSGRGMYGDNCLAVTLDNDQNLCEFFADVLDGLSERQYDDENHELLESLTKAFLGARTDSMGKGEVIYFPKIQYRE